MKKTLKIAVLLCLVTVMICLASCNKQPTQPQETTPTATTPAETTPEVTTPEPTTPSEPVLVDSINGKTVLEIMEEFAAAESFDYSLFIIGTEIETGVEVVNTQTIRFNNDEFTMCLQADEAVIYIAYVDGICYQSYGDGAKTKFSADSIEAVFEQVFSGIDIRKNAGNNIPQEGLDMLSKADIYFYEDVYTITLEIEREGEIHSTTLSFNAAGKVIKTESYANQILISEFTYHSYGEPIEILPPEDADEYVLEEW